MIIPRMSHKFPKPAVNVKCSVCYIPLVWSDELDTFECTSCMLKLHHLGDGTFKMVYSRPGDITCGHPPVESYKKIRHLRQNVDNIRYFVVFSYIFFPCSLPKGHKSHHYFHTACKYSEESVDSYHRTETNAKDIDLDT